MHAILILFAYCLCGVSARGLLSPQNMGVGPLAVFGFSASAFVLTFRSNAVRIRYALLVTSSVFSAYIVYSGSSLDNSSNYAIAVVHLIASISSILLIKNRAALIATYVPFYAVIILATSFFTAGTISIILLLGFLAQGFMFIAYETRRSRRLGIRTSFGLGVVILCFAIPSMVHLASRYESLQLQRFHDSLPDAERTFGGFLSRIPAGTDPISGLGRLFLFVPELVIATASSGGPDSAELKSFAQNFRTPDQPVRVMSLREAGVLLLSTPSDAVLTLANRSIQGPLTYAALVSLALVGGALAVLFGQWIEIAVGRRLKIVAAACRSADPTESLRACLSSEDSYDEIDSLTRELVELFDSVGAKIRQVESAVNRRTDLVRRFRAGMIQTLAKNSEILEGLAHHFSGKGTGPERPLPDVRSFAKSLRAQGMGIHALFELAVGSFSKPAEPAWGTSITDVLMDVASTHRGTEIDLDFDEDEVRLAVPEDSFRRILSHSISVIALSEGRIHDERSVTLVLRRSSPSATPNTVSVTIAAAGDGSDRLEGFDALRELAIEIHRDSLRAELSAHAEVISAASTDRNLVIVEFLCAELPSAVTSL